MSRFEGLSLLDLIPALRPEFKSPYHLADWAALIERAATEPVRAICAVPIRHFKTETTLAGIVWLLIQDPTLRIIFLTHSHEAAESRGKGLRQLAKETSVGPTRGWDKIAEWRNDQGGGVVVMSAEQSKLGYDCHVLVFDDPLDEHGSEDANTREAADATIAHYTARCMRRGKPGPVLGVMSRFHPDDPAGRRLSRQAAKWIYVHHPAIIDEGTPTERAFAPDVWDLPELKAIRAELAERDPTERLWWSQFMGNPLPSGGVLFEGSARYAEAPPEGMRIALGVDIAYTGGTKSDHGAIVSLGVLGPLTYILHVDKFQLRIDVAEARMRFAFDRYPGADAWSYVSGVERGPIILLAKEGIVINPVSAKYNKLVRAQKCAQSWKAGRVLVPNAGTWVKPFLAEVASFTGAANGIDDQVDAMVSGFDMLQASVSAWTPGLAGPPRCV